MSRRGLLIACILGLWGVPHSLQAAPTTATSTVNANIAFAEPLQVSSNTQNINLPVLITINTYGSLWIDRTKMSGVQEAEQHDSINFMGPNDQLMNFLTLAYNEDNSGNMVPIKSICSVNGTGDESCNKLYGSMQNDKGTMYSGMDTLFLTSLAPSASKNSKLSFFDLCAVYQ